MKKIFLTAVVLFSTLIYLSCSNEQTNSQDELSKKLKELEIKVSEKISTSRYLYSEEETFSEINNYDNVGISFLRTLESIESKTRDLKQINSSNTVSAIQPYLDQQTQSFLPNIQFNETERILMESFANNLTLYNGIEKAKLYEEFVFQNFQDQSRVKNFMIAVSIIKYTSYSVERRKRTFTAWESCVNDCMRDRFESYNIVDWIAFVATNPGANVLINYAACGWECY